MTTETTSFKIAERKLRALLERLQRRNVCECCTARALIYNGVALLDETMGTAEVVELLEEVLADLHAGPPTPSRSPMPSTEAH